MIDQHPSSRKLRARLIAEVEVLRRCIDWLEQLERGEDIVVNLRPEMEVETEFVRFDRPRVMRVLSMIVADLDELACRSNGTNSVDVVDNEAQAKHRRRLAEPEPKLQRLSQREERDALREACGLPPYSSS